MKKAVVLLAVVALALSARTAPVSAHQAAAAASAWAGAPAARTTSVALESGASVYAVGIRGGGTVFLSPDSASAPVVAFTSATNDFSTIDRNSPLWALLSRDAEVRAFARTNSAAKAGSSEPSAAAKSAEAAWASLLSASSGEDASPLTTHIAQVVQSKWDQTTAGGKLCYNRHTPVLKTGSHAMCGCVATAMSQIMRCHQFPTAAREPVTRTCYVNSYAATKEDGPDYAAFITNLTTQAGVYDWASMPLVPADGVTDAQCEAIGKLTSDAGISVSMMYGTDASGSSGAFSFNVPSGLKKAFGYANADYYRSSEVSASTTAMTQGLLANLDAGYPVLMGISGDGGHAIVGDGYGYEDDALYVHLNMGWSGSSDFWYNLPDIDTANSYHFTVFDDIVCNVFPEDAEKNALLTGRVVDDDGRSFDGVSVRIYAAGTTTLVATDLTTNGVYGVRVPAGTYDVEIAKKGFPVETLSSVAVAATTSVVDNDDNGVIAEFADGTRWLVPLSYSKVSSFGNSYGNDVTMTEPCAQIVVGGATTNLYATLDKAIAGGRALVASGAADVKIELLQSIQLDASTTIDYDCELTTAKGVADAVSVTRAAGAALAVAAGGSLALHDVVFASGSSAVVTVAAGGTLRLGSGVDFGVPSTIAAVKTADAAGFVLAGSLTTGFSLDCEAAKLVKGVFGSSTLDVTAASDSAARIANSHDSYGEQRGAAAADSSGAVVLSWANVPVPLTDAAAYFTDKDGNTVAAARLDRALATYLDYQAQGLLGDSSEIVVRDSRGLSLSQKTTVTGSMTLRGETAGVTVSDIASGAGFVVGDGASLTVKNLAFDGAARSDGSELKLDTLFLVNGGTLAVKDATFENLTSTNCYSPAVSILSGKATVSSSTFANCRADGKTNQRYGGGGIFVNDGASLALADTSITGCYAATFGGGVFAYYGASVAISGNMVVRDNASGLADPLGQSDNLHLLAGFSKEAALTLAGTVTGDVGVFWRKTAGTTPRQSSGGVFATAASASVATASASAFLNDRDATLVAAADGANLVWKARVKSDREVDDPDDAIAVVTPADGGATRYYASLADAVATLTGDATIAMRADDTLTNEVAVSCAVILRSSGSTPVTVGRGANPANARKPSPGLLTVAAGGSLVVSNLTLSGSSKPGTLVSVSGGALTLANGATVKDVDTCYSQNASAIYVSNGGTFTMESGSRVSDCSNDYSNDAKFGYAIGGGVRVSRSTAYLKGGTVTSCSSVSGGGVAITDKSTVYVSGDMRIIGNTDDSLSDSDNLLVSDNSTLCLADKLTGPVGVMTGVAANTNVFGCVASSASLSGADLANSAHKFTNDETGDVGLAVKPKAGTGDTLLVWSDAIDKDGNVVVNGTNYVTVAGGATLTAAVGAATTNFVYNGSAQSPTFGGHGFAVVAAARTAAGTYSGTLTPKAGFQWGRHHDVEDVRLDDLEGDVRHERRHVPGRDFRIRR